MGLDEHLFDSAASKHGLHVLKQFQCSVCLDVVEEPVITRCSHLFCKSCLKGDKCPTCRSEPADVSDLREASPALYRILGGLSLRCPNSTPPPPPIPVRPYVADTATTISSSTLPTPVAVPDFSSRREQQQQRKFDAGANGGVSKRNKGGGEEKNAPASASESFRELGSDSCLSDEGEGEDELETHRQRQQGGRQDGCGVGEDGEVQCTWRGVYADLHKHMTEVCPKRTVICQICGAKVCAVDMDAHNASEASSHLAIMQERLASCARIEDLGDRIGQLEAKLERYVKHKHPDVWTFTIENASKLFSDTGGGNQDFNLPKFAIGGPQVVEGFYVNVELKEPDCDMGIFLFPPPEIRLKAEYSFFLGPGQRASRFTTPSISKEFDPLPEGEVVGTGKGKLRNREQLLNLCTADDALIIGVEFKSLRILKTMNQQNKEITIGEELIQ
ncbi:unnamed protein product [Vitrella brassicaformis CCMP3155]|uniref:RING-type domain-containing protein n=2 Tax=Vitrella brassicaformis TaxID=1169539 RepID=A0A0G4FKD6_VITBC|nr:unnamed protein product [Vitrella brassicaformis CCMP3155]|eukprot:CEM14029.1 unnamed protein product [Vitrella brassicaformis CCMP3155]